MVVAARLFVRICLVWRVGFSIARPLSCFYYLEKR